MKPISIALTMAALLSAVSTANAWLGDSEDALSRRYGKPKAVELSNGSIPTQRGYYGELKEHYSTNVSLIASTAADYSMDLVENRKRYSFQKDGLAIMVYVGNTNEQYKGVDFAGKSAREVISCPVVWKKNKNGDKVGHPVAFSPAAINAILRDNQSDSAWADDWHAISPPGTYIKRTIDKSRLAIAYGVSENEIYRLDIQMADDATKSAN
jgi:hypothetical protein